MNNPVRFHYTAPCQSRFQASSALLSPPKRIIESIKVNSLFAFLKVYLYIVCGRRMIILIL